MAQLSSYQITALQEKWKLQKCVLAKKSETVI